MMYSILPPFRPPVTCSLKTKLMFTMNYQSQLLVDMEVGIKQLKNPRNRPQMLRLLAARKNLTELRRVFAQVQRYYFRLVK